MADRAVRVAVKIRARAPMRIDWAGGWTDVPRYAEVHGGAVASTAVSLHAHVEVLLGQHKIRLHAEDLGEHVVLASAGLMRYDGRLDLHKAALNMLPVTGGVEVITRSEAPAGSGLGGSGALEVALLSALASAREESYDPGELAEMAFVLEAGELKLTGGRQDQYAAAFGGSNVLKFSGDGVIVRPVTHDPALADDLARHLVLAYTGRSHFSHQTHERVWQRFAAGEADVADALATMLELAGEAASALEAADWEALARVADENWRQQQRLDATIATPRILAMDRAARDAGAWGLKATGAGAGGCIVCLAPAHDRDAVAAACRAAGATVLDAVVAPRGASVEVEPDDDDDR